MAGCGVGTLVWVRRKNGSWWPGRVLDLNELSPSHFIISISRTPVQLLGKDNGPVEWFNSEMSECIKEFRCSEFDGLIKWAESSRASPSTKTLKYAYRIDAIVHALELEKKEVCRKRKMPECYAEEEQIGAVCRSKRSRCASVPAGSNNCLERTSFHSKPLPVLPSSMEEDGDSYQPSSAQDKSSFRSNETYSSKIDACKGERYEALKKLSDCYKGRQPGNVNYKEHDQFNHLSESAQSALQDVKLTIQANYRKEHVPLVSLVSRLNGKAIIGHPIEIEAFEDGFSENLLHNSDDDIGNQVFDNGTPLLQPARPTARRTRTPVCYAATSFPSSTLKVGKPDQAYKKDSHLKLKARENKSRTKQEIRPLKKCNLAARLNCVPVKLVVSKLLVAIGLQPGAAND